MCILSLTIFGIVLYFIIHYLVLSYNVWFFFFLMPVKNMDNKILFYSISYMHLYKVLLAGCQ